MNPSQPPDLENVSALDVVISRKSQSDNHLTIRPSAKMIDIEIVQLIFIALNVDVLTQFHII